MFHISYLNILQDSVIVLLDLEWITKDDERYIYQIAFKGLFSTAVNNIYVCPPVKSDSFSSAPKEAISSKVTIGSALDLLWKYIDIIRHNQNKEKCFIVTHGAFSGDKEVTEAEIARSGCYPPKDVFWVDSKRICEVVLSKKLSLWKSSNCRCRGECECKTFSLSQIHSYVIADAGYGNPWPLSAYHKAQNDVLALGHILNYLWTKNIFSGTACSFGEKPFVNSRNNSVTPRMEFQLIANGISKVEDLAEIAEKSGEDSMLSHLRSLGFSSRESQNISALVTTSV